MRIEYNYLWTTAFTDTLLAKHDIDFANKYLTLTKL